MRKIIAIFCIVCALLLISADIAFENMPAPQNASFSPIYSTYPFFEPVKAKSVSSPFGYRFHPISEEFDFHYGIDLTADAKEPIYAVIGGIVRVSKTDKSYGNYIIIDHYNGFSTLYAHCSKLLAKEGDIVLRGEKIALVGKTGEATGNHLHFEVRINGIKYDPDFVLNLREGF